MKKEILTGIAGLLVTVLAFGSQTGNSLMNTLAIDMDSISYIEEEKPIDLGFDTAAYLPENFDAYGVPENFMDISYMEEEDEVRFDYDIKEYLPETFNPFEDYKSQDVPTLFEKGNILQYKLRHFEVLPADTNSEVTF